MIKRTSHVKSNSPIGEEFSVYLDLLRVVAAYYVMLFHMKKLQLGPETWLMFVPDHGHDAVILFFVLSGYVIAAATEKKQALGFREYLLDRASRVYSVALPALLLSAFLALSFQSLLKVEKPYSLDELAVSTVANLLFLGQSWNWKIWVFYNQPYWSLCYEVMYYVGFGVFIFARGWTRWLGLFVVALIAGPKVVLLLPCWVLGVLAYKYRDLLPLKTGTGLAIGFVLPALILIALSKLGFGPAVRTMALELWGDQKASLEFSKDFLIDYVTASLVAVNLYAARYIRFPFLLFFKRAIVVAASFSFTLYLMHLPMIFLLVNSLGGSVGSAYSF
ncbi:MAG: acyltransferase family protein, partial [Pseudomonadota bacterium]